MVSVSLQAMDCTSQSVTVTATRTPTTTSLLDRRLFLFCGFWVTKLWVTKFPLSMFFAQLLGDNLSHARSGVRKLWRTSTTLRHHPARQLPARMQEWEDACGHHQTQGAGSGGPHCSGVPCQGPYSRPFGCVWGAGCGEMFAQRVRQCG